MRIVLLNQYYAPDGAATAQLAADLGAGLAAAGHDVAAVCSDHAYADPSRRYPRRETIDGVRVERVATTAFGRRTRAGRLLDYAAFALGAARRLSRLRFGAGSPPDVVVSLTTPPLIGLVGARSARRAGAASVLWSMDVYPEIAFALGALPPFSLAGRAASAASRRLLRATDAAVALDTAMGERLSAAGARRVAVIANWADGDAIRPRPVAGHPLRRLWGWEGRFVVVYSGNLGLAHDFETILAAALELAGDPGVRFAFLGDGQRFERLRTLVRDRGLGNVEVRPGVERAKLGESLTAADAHFVTLRDGLEGLLVPSKIYGILAAGRPVLYVGPDAGGVADAVRESHGGVRVGNGDGDGLARAISAYAASPARRDEDGRRARAHFDRTGGRDRALAGFTQLFDSLEIARPATILDAQSPTGRE